MELFFALAARILSNSLANVFQKKLAGGGVCAGRVIFGSYALVALAALPMLPWRENLGLGFWALCLASGALGAAGNYFLVRALEIGDLSVLGPINSYKAVVGMLFGAALLGEVPDFSGLSGVLLIICGSFLLVGKTAKFSAALFGDKSVRFRFYALVFAACEAVFLKKIILESSVGAAFAAWAVFGAAFSLPLARGGGFSRASFSARSALLFAGIAISIGTMQYATNAVFANMQVGYALALFQLSGVLSVFFGALFFGEKNIMRKFAGSLIMCSGAALIFV